jgi:hypothetical protein
VPDCQSALLREYWRTFTPDGTTAYVLPRPDGAPELQPVCLDSQSDLRNIVELYHLCSAANNSDEVAVVNHIQLGDALRITHFLHSQLKFVVTTDGIGIQPFPIPSDILDACALDAGASSQELQAICDRELDRVLTGSLVAFTYNGPGAVELVLRLNQLYGT